MTMKILITGGAGFIGSHIAEYFVEHYNDVYIIDNLVSGYRENVDFIKDENFFNIDVTNYTEVNELIETYQFDVIIHLAAMVSVVETVEKPEQSNKVNIDAVLNILQACREKNPGIKKIIFASSAAVYGNEKSLPKSTHSPIQPESPYAIQKYCGEQYVKLYSSLYNLPTVSLRFFNVYGPKQDPKSQYSGVLSIIKSAFEKDEIFNLYGDGKQTRDFVYVKDVVQAVKIVLENEGCNGGVYNVGTGTATSLLTIIDTFSKLINKQIEINYLNSRKGDVKYSYADITELKAFGYTPMYSIGKGLNEYLEYSNLFIN